MKELIINTINCTEKEADKIIELYLKEKIATRNAHDDIRVKHGIFLERDVLINALAETNKGGFYEETYE